MRQAGEEVALVDMNHSADEQRLGAGAGKDQPISIVHVLRTYGVHGGERQLGRLFAAESSSQYRNTFLSIYRNRACDAYYAKIPGLTCKTVMDFEAPVFPSLRREMLLLLVLLPLLQLRVLYHLARSDCRICVVHGVQAAAACWTAAWILRRIKFIYVHRGTKSEAGSHSIFKLLYLPYDAVAGVSIATADSLKPLVRSGKTVALENGIDWQAFAVSAEQCEKKARSGVITLISSARLLPHKAQAFLLDAFAIVEKHRPDIELIVAGDGPERDNLIAKAEKLGVAAKIKFIGHVPDIPCRIVNSDIFVHASEVEGMSNAILEAMTLAVPCVVVDAPGVSECHIDGNTGFVVPRQPQLMADKLIALIDDRELRRSMGNEARKRVQAEYSISANVRRYHALYDTMLARA